VSPIADFNLLPFDLKNGRLVFFTDKNRVAVFEIAEL
jgi:hypothetical protein